MVCETPRLRSLLVSRRGGFLEDPFFRDAWGDYNNAVRRIVDRFNHGGMFAPRDRLRDSHYHSMYRTLRSARINYSAQAARFKDEGDSYKLVMDVREFVGGDLTVRTAGGTLSVRGRLETGGEGGDADSTTSRASSARTLHRRFNLPPDADGEKVESMLSRDAVLTVTMPKRTDVRVIPVTMEGAGGGGRSGTKRHSATQPDPGPSPRKRPQDHHDPKDTDKRTTQTPRERSTSRRRHAFGMSENKDGERGRDNERQNRREREEETERSRERTSRRGSDIFMRGGCNRDEEEGHRRRSYLDSTPRGVNQETDYGDKDNVSSNRRRSRDIVEDETEDKHGQRNRRRTSKYEDVKEINIPIRLENSGDAETVEQYPAAGDINTTTTHTGSTSASLSKNKIDSPPVTQSRDRDNTQHRPTVRQKVENEASIASDKPHISSTISKDKSNIHKVSEKENIKPCEEGSPWTYSNLYVNNSQTKEKGRESQTNATKATRGKEADATKKYHFGNKSQGEPEVRVVAPPETPATALDANTHKQQLKQKDAKGDAKESVKYHDVCVQKDKADKRQDDSEGNNNYLRNSSQDSESPESGSKSPCGGREVKVEKKQSDMEGDMFKDCWQNFSSTLQEVLARLQELSSELGHSKPQSKTSSPSTASSRQSPPSPSPQQPSNIRVASSRNSPHEEVNKRPTSVSSEGSEWVAGERGTTVGVGGKPPTTPPPVYADERLATRSGLNGHGAKYAKDFTTHQDPCVTQTKKTTRYEADKPGMQQVSGSSVSENVSGVPRRGSGDGGGGRGGGARARDNTRPVSLVLPNSAQGDAIRQHIPMNLDLEGSSDDLSTKVSKLQTNDAPGPRPRPTSLNVTHEGTLLKDLRKSSPVDALKDRFLSHITPTSESSPGITDVHYIPVEVEATKTVPTTSRVPEDTASRGRHTATGVPLHQRRGKGVNSLVIVDDDKSSTSSSQVSTSTSEDNSNATSSADSEGGVDSKGGWKVPHLADKAAAGNSSALNLGPDPFQQHSSSRGGGADSRAQPHGIGSGSVTGGSKPKPSPLLSSTSPSDSDPDVDEIISQAERVIEETRRLSASAANDSLVVNDLGRDKHSAIKRDKVKSTGTTSKRSGFNLAPNIDTRSSPESNFVEIQEEDHTQHNKGKGEEAEGVVEGCLSIPLLGPAGRPGRPRHKPTRTAHTHVATPPTRNDSLLIEAVDDTDDVTECEEVRPTIVKSPEIQSSDVMGCARESGRGGGSEAPPSPQEAPPRTLAHQAQPTRAPRRPSSRERMGGLFSRGRSDDSPRYTPSSSPSVAAASTRSKVSPTPQTPSTPTRPHRPREHSTTPQEEPPLPPYVRQKSDTSKRYSGFSHVLSDNVRKMREAWSNKQESPPLQQRRGTRVPSSPPPSPRRAPDSPRRAPDSPRRAPDSPRRAPDSPRRSSLSRSTPTRESPSRSPTKTNNYYNSTFSSRSRSSSSPRRGSTSSTEGVPSAARDDGRTTYASAKSGRPLADNYSQGGSAARRPSPARTARRTPPPAAPSEPPPASPFHQKLFRRLRDASLQPDSETICFTEEEDRYKLVMDVEEYVQGEIEVLQDDKHLTVKGRLSTTQRGNTTTRTFNRNFHIPKNTREEDIDSALSKDGILTVYVPKKKERVIKIQLTD